MPPFRAVALLLSANLMTGCAVGPDYQRPHAVFPERYMDQATVEQRAAATPASRG